MILTRIFVTLLAALVFAVGSVFALCYTIARGPSETVRNMLVLSAMQASATKWAPGLFLDKALVDEIVAQSKVVVVDEIDISDYAPEPEHTGADGETVDEWADAPDGIRLLTLSGATYRAYLMIVREPERVFVGISGNFESARYGMRIFDGADKYGAVAAINGGEFNDANGQGTGAAPMGLTYSRGECVWNDGYVRTFMGFDRDNRLVVAEAMTKKEADALGIRDAVCFQTGNVLINRDGDTVRLHYTEGDNGAAQRTAIGQRADGAVLLLVTDGRTASSIGATHNDVIDIMYEYGAVSAAMLDGGSSAMMYRRDYAALYGVDESSLDDWQKQGMVNKYKAFTNPRRIPTYFMVAPAEEQQ